MPTWALVVIVLNLVATICGVAFVWAALGITDRRIIDLVAKLERFIKS